MISTLKKKILSTMIVALYAMSYAIPAVAVTAQAPVLKSGVDKPVLRTPASSSVLKLEGDISITKGNPKVSLSLRDSDVKQVLRMFADKAGLNIVFHTSVAGQVTLDLVSVPLNDAFKLVMQITDLTYFIDKNTMVVASASAAGGMNMAKQEMISLPVKYVDAAKMAEFLNKNIFALNKPGLSTSDIAITNPSTNEVLIFGTDNDARIAKKIIDKFDMKPISTSFMVNHTTPKEMANLVCNMLLPAASSGKATGGAANSSSEISIGEGVLACSIENKVNAGKLSSFNGQNLSVSFFPQRGTLGIMGGSQQQIDLIKDFIMKNDKKQPQAYLEVSIVELNESGTRQFDNTWQIWSSFFSASFSGGTTSSHPAYPTFLSGSGFDVVKSDKPGDIDYKLVKYSGTPTITWAINYLVENQKGRILANPRIMITNGQESTIDMTSDYIKTVKSEVLSGVTSLAGAVQRTYEVGDDDGLKITMIPFISPEGYVTLNINPDYATIKEKVYSLGTDGKTQDLQATLLQRRNLELKNIRIKDGETLVIGGMIREDEQKTVKKVPILGDIPVVGPLFRSTSTTKAKNELVIMITPKIIKDSEDVKANMEVTL